MKEAKKVRFIGLRDHMLVTRKYVNKLMGLYDERVESEINELSSKIDRLSRIVENHDHSEITFKNDCPMNGYAIKDDGSISDKPITTSFGCFIYLNNIEYFIEKLTLNTPKFTKEGYGNVLVIEDTMNCVKNSNVCATEHVEYVVDLDKGTFIRTK